MENKNNYNYFIFDYPFTFSGIYVTEEAYNKFNKMNLLNSKRQELYEKEKAKFLERIKTEDIDASHSIKL